MLDPCHNNLFERILVYEVRYHSWEEKFDRCDFAPIETGLVRQSIERDEKIKIVIKTD